jgi:hypothetical protein
MEHLLIYLLLFWTPHLTLMLTGSSFLSLSHRACGSVSWPPECAAAFSSDAGRLALLHLRLFSDAHRNRGELLDTPVPPVLPLLCRRGRSTADNSEHCPAIPPWPWEGSLLVVAWSLKSRGVFVWVL